MSSPNFTTVLLVNGSEIEAEIVVLSRDGNNGCAVVGGNTSFPIPIHKNAFGVWEEVIEEKEDGTSKAIAELLATEVAWVEPDRAYISSKQHGSSRWHIVGETYEGGVQIDQTVTGEKYPSRVNFAPDEIPALLNVLLAAYLKIKNTEDEVLGDLPEHPF